MPPELKELAADGYIFVIQNLRGRFKSEGTFTLSDDALIGRARARSRPGCMGHDRLARQECVPTTTVASESWACLTRATRPLRRCSTRIRR